MKLVFIRHGATAGNLEGRYIGRTDEGLCGEGRKMLAQKAWPEADIVYTSPMKRCVQTAQIIYPEKAAEFIRDFRECDFGDFEGKNYQGLNGNADYQRWIDSGGQLPFPGGEDPADFRARCAAAFADLIGKQESDPKEVIAFVVHGGTIMSILERYEKHHEYYRWQCGNGCGYQGEWTDGRIEVMGIV